MAITSITIENFKCIGDAVTVPIRPITLLFGKNSSGKSTVLQALRYLRKIYECKYLKFEEKLEALQDQERDESKLEAHCSLLTLLQELPNLRTHLSARNFREIQKIISKDISNVDLSNFDSLRDKALKSMQEKFNLPDDWLAEGDNYLNEKGDYGEYGEINPDLFTALGNFPSLVHRHELDRKIRIRLEFDIKPEQLTSSNSILHRAIRPEEVTNPKSAWVEMVTGWDEKQEVIYLDSYKYALNGVEWICLTPMDRPMSDKAGWNYERRFIDLNIYSNPNHPFTFTRAMEFGLSQSELLKDFSWLLDTDSSEGEKFGLSESKKKNIRSWLEEHEREDLINNIVEELHRILGELCDIQHLGPVRDIPRRDYAPYSYEELRWATGLQAWDVLVGKPQLVKKINQYMKNLALGYSFRLSEDRKQRMQLYDETHKIHLHPLDIGFGISQVIPVVVGALDDSQNLGIFAVEQPELHIHPAVQVALGDVFIDGIKDSYRTMLIETHSEHLLLRLLRRVRETTRRSRYQTTELEQTAHELTPNDLSVVYVRPTPAGVKFTPLTVTDNGDFDAPWPEGFFDERDSELF